MGEKPIKTIKILKKHREIIRNLARQITVFPSENPQLFCEQVKILSSKIPNEILEEIRLTLSGNDADFEQSAILIKFPLLHLEIPDTPSNNNLLVGEKTILSKIQALLLYGINNTHINGQIVGYEAEGYGQLFQDIVPIKQKESKQTSTSSKYELELHTEQAFSQMKPDMLCLGCLRGNKDAQTYLLPLSTILDSLSVKEMVLLKQPLWTIGVDQSFLIDENGNKRVFISGEHRGPISILQTKNEFVFDQDLMKGDSYESKQIIEKITKIYYTKRLSICLSSGDILFINNKLTTHGRSAFIPKYDKTDRFLIRSFFIEDFSKTQGKVDQYTILAKYS
jgi:L-asparagine oxygenase